MRFISFLFIVLLAIIGITFACLNADIVTINYYVGTTELPLPLLLVLVLALGALLGLSVGLAMLIGSKREIYHLKQRLKVTEKEIENLRVIPVKDGR